MRTLANLVGLALLLVTGSASAQWTYHNRPNDMGEPMRIASVRSVNSHNFEFPYRGNTHADLVIRRINNRLDAYISIDRGQIICHSGRCTHRLKWDDEAPTPFSGSSSTSNDPTIVFLPNAARLDQRLQKASQLRVELTIHHEGQRVWVFNVQGYSSLAPPAKKK